MTAFKMSIARLAAMLGPALRGLAFDETGIAGDYSFKLDWDYVEAPPPDSGVSLFTALQEQLGLKLESVKRPLEHLVIDHAEKPTGN